MKLNEFIRSNLVDQIGEIIPKHPYLSYSLISQGIELIGACLDNRDFHSSGQSEKRFNIGLKLFDPKYHPFTNKRHECYLYSELRCGLIHALLPRRKLVLGEKANDPYPNLSKQELRDGRESYVLIIEDLFNDFITACRTLISMLEDKSIMNSHNYSIASQDKKAILNLSKDFIRGDL